jgi:two-component system CitB family response regulator
MQKVLDTVRGSAHPIGAAEIATSLGMSRPTAQRYLTELERRGVVELKLEYGSTGRPVNWYVARRKA